jgi:hypothetical protein
LLALNLTTKINQLHDHGIGTVLLCLIIKGNTVLGKEVCLRMNDTEMMRMILRPPDVVCHGIDLTTIIPERALPLCQLGTVFVFREEES